MLLQGAMRSFIDTHLSVSSLIYLAPLAATAAAAPSDPFHLIMNPQNSYLGSFYPHVYRFHYSIQYPK